jgi:glycosyltransferase involved in cell wall biosynthesis
MTDAPFISIITPVYNGGPYLAEAIESVLSQSYVNYEYIIVDNRSTDDSLSVARRYASSDSRIRVFSNDVFVDCESNHNIGFRLISPESRYCKVVSADDWLLPGALSRFVNFATEHPGVGIVGSYQRSGDTIRWTGLPPETTVIAGKDICRLGLLENVHVFGNPTSALYRSDLVRARHDFFPHSRPHADTSACYASLQECDFGFIHEVLSVERVHEQQVSSKADALNAGDLAYLEILLDYGLRYLTAAEFRQRWREVETCYYETVVRGLLRLNGGKYLRFHQTGMRNLGRRLSKFRILTTALAKLGSELLHPLEALLKLTGADSKRQRPA